MAAGYFVDSGLLTLLAVGNEDRSLTSDARLYLEAMKGARDVVAVNFAYLRSV